MPRFHPIPVIGGFALVLTLGACSAPTASDLPTVTASPSAAAELCGFSFFHEVVELDISEMPTPGGVTLPEPDCLVQELIDDPVFSNYHAFYLDTSGSIWAEYEAALLGAGFRADGNADHSWSLEIIDPQDEHTGYGFVVQGDDVIAGIRDGEALDVFISVPIV
jgi:hypothetical protein